jgi:hypothetical protein
MFHTCEFEFLKKETIPVNYDSDYLDIDMELEYSLQMLLTNLFN